MKVEFTGIDLFCVVMALIAAFSATLEAGPEYGLAETRVWIFVAIAFLVLVTIKRHRSSGTERPQPRQIGR